MEKVDLKTVHSLNNPPMTECPFCGGKEFFIHQYASGSLEYYYHFDGEVAENGDLHQGLNYTDKGKFAYCAECRKRLFRYKD